MFEQAIHSLEEFSKVIGKEPRDLPGMEGFGQIRCEIQEFPVPMTLQIELEDLSRMFKGLGEAAYCQFSLHDEDMSPMEEEPPQLIATRRTTQADIDRFRKRIKACRTIHFYFQVDKNQLLKSEQISAPSCRFHLYLYPSALIRFLRGESTTGNACNVHESLKALEDKLLPEGQTDHKSVILVEGHDIFLNGPYFALVGGEHLLRWRETIPPGPIDFAALKTIYKQCRDHVTWDDCWLTDLTPPRLLVETAEYPENDKMLPALRIHLLNLIVLFTANRTAGTDKDWTVTYSDSNNTKNMSLFSPAQLHWDSGRLDGIGNFYNIFQWVYISEWPGDRIPFAQSAIAQELVHNSTIEESYQVLLDKSSLIRNNLDRRWRQFIHQKNQEYTTEEREFEEFIVRTVDAFAERVTAMVKAVSDTMLAAIAALFGSFIAAGFGSDQFNEFIFTVGMIVYSLYVLAFPLLYGMSNQWTHYKAIHESMDTALTRFRERLGETEANKIVGSRLEQSDRRFKDWFFITTAVYVAAIILGFLAPSLVLPLME